MARGKHYDVAPTPQNFRALWDRIHALEGSVSSAQDLIDAQAATIATLKTTLSATTIKAQNALILAGKPYVPPTSGSQDDPGGGSDPPPPPPPPPNGVCSSQPLSAELPAWFYNALVAAGVDPAQNCFTEADLEAIEGDCNANDFTPERDSGCTVRPRLYHQGNHGMWGTFCGHPDASQVADFHVNISVTNSDGSISWGWR